jgi:anti-sigma factor RsiW
MNVPKHEYDEAAEARKFGVHHQLRPDLKALLDGELTAPRLWFVRAHLWFCPACREEVKWLKRLGEDMRDLERAVPSPRLRARILAALPDTPPGRPAIFPARTARITRFVVAGAIACLCIAVLAAVGRYGTLFHAPQPPTLARSTGGSSDTHPSQQTVGVTPPQAIIPTTPDPHTVAADQMLAQWEQREATQLHNNRSSWSKLAASLHTLSAGHRVDEPLHLALAVPDLNDAEYRLAAWTTSVGGAVLTPPHPQPSPNSVAPMVTTVEPVYRPTGVTPVAPEPIITIRVPLARVASLEPILKQIGAWDTVRTTFSSTSEQPGAAERPAPMMKQGPRSNRPVEAAADANGPPTNIAAARPGLPNQAASRDSTPASVTIRIHLTSLEALLP